ncbi:prefoldin subunit 5, partial [Pyrgilauda ruficollis]|uniref:prefoldin subunit 5 n=1 Tax=Pyrgilauda ruficollis TaxID=221976 RepID=UPI001B85F0BE
PLVLGNLWDVTDRDLDRLAQALLRGWLGGGPGTPLLAQLAQARQAPRLKSLIGAAPVAYGLPRGGLPKSRPPPLAPTPISGTPPQKKRVSSSSSSSLWGHSQPWGSPPLDPLPQIPSAGVSPRERGPPGDPPSLEAPHTPQEVEFLSSSLAQLKVVQTKFVEAKECLNVLHKGNEGKDLLVPLTSSMYVPGKLQDVRTVLVDVGTGYYVEKVGRGLWGGWGPPFPPSPSFHPL